MRNISKCLEDNVPMPMWRKLYQELRIPPRHTAVEECAISGLKIWILINAEATWQQFSMALYISTLDDALEKMKELNLLPIIGTIALYVFLFVCDYCLFFKQKKH